MRKIHCNTCGRLVGVVDMPSPEKLKGMLKEASTQKQDAKTAILLASAQTLLPMLPPEAFDLLTTTMPYHCPACVVEFDIGQLAEETKNARTQEERNEAQQRTDAGGTSGVGSADADADAR